MRAAHLPEKTGLRTPQLEKRAAPTPKTPPSIGFHMGDRNVNSRLPLLVNNSNGSNFDGSPMLTISSCKDNVAAHTKYKNTTYSPASSCFSNMLSIAMRHSSAITALPESIRTIASLCSLFIYTLNFKMLYNILFFFFVTLNIGALRMASEGKIQIVFKAFCVL